MKSKRGKQDKQVEGKAEKKIQAASDDRWQEERGKKKMNWEKERNR